MVDHKIAQGRWEQIDDRAHHPDDPRDVDALLSRLDGADDAPRHRVWLEGRQHHLDPRKPLMLLTLSEEGGTIDHLPKK